MNRREKQESVEALQKSFQTHAALFALDFRGLKVEEATSLRSKVRESGARYQVVKNTLGLRALKGTDFSPLSEHFKGMTGVAYTDSDPVALAKVLNDFAKDVPALTYKAGMISGRPVGSEEFKALATLPSKEALQAQFLSVLLAPARNFLGVLQAPARDFILVLKAAAQKGEGK